MEAILAGKLFPPDVHLYAVCAVCGCPLTVLLPPTHCNSTLERLTGESRQSLHDQPTFSFLVRSLRLCTHACANIVRFSNFTTYHLESWNAGGLKESVLMWKWTSHTSRDLKVNLNS